MSSLSDFSNKHEVHDWQENNSSVFMAGLE